MSARSQKRRNNQQESSEIVSEILNSSILVRNVESADQDVPIAGPSSAKSPRIEYSVLEMSSTLNNDANISRNSVLIKSLKRNGAEFPPNLGSIL